MLAVGFLLLPFANLLARHYRRCLESAGRLLTHEGYRAATRLPFLPPPRTSCDECERSSSSSSSSPSPSPPADPARTRPSLSESSTAAATAAASFCARAGWSRNWVQLTAATFGDTAAAVEIQRRLTRSAMQLLTPFVRRTACRRLPLGRRGGASRQTVGRGGGCASATAAHGKLPRQPHTKCAPSSHRMQRPANLV